MVEDFSLVQRLDLIKKLCSGKRVLHLGCTNFPYTVAAIENDMLLHFELERIATSLWGIDADQEGIEILKAHGSKNIVLGNLENLEQLELDGKFDVIVAGEMIEHLNNPGLFLQGIKRFMDTDSVLVITTINAFCGMRFFWYGIRGKRGKHEAVHPDHVAYYSYSTLKLLVERNEMRVDNFLFYDIGSEHRPHNRWFLNTLNDICVKIAPQWADGIIAICQKVK
ncbi:MAG: class I SAM-dependent methyltransferase [Pyrinomonadaceae bacterium]